MKQHPHANTVKLVLANLGLLTLTELRKKFKAVTPKDSHGHFHAALRWCVDKGHVGAGLGPNRNRYRLNPFR